MSPAKSAGAQPRLDTEFDSADESPGLLLWQVTNKWQVAVRTALAPFGLTHVQFVLLASLTWMSSDGPVMQKDLAEHAATDVMMTSQVLRTLETAGLIRRDPHPDDGRARALSVTEPGVNLANRAVVAVESCDRAFFAVLGRQSGLFAGSLKKLRDAAAAG